MLVARSMHAGWLSNTWLVATGAGGPCLLVDAGGPVEPLQATIEAEGLAPAAVLLTHHHHDHVARLEWWQARWDVEALCHPLEREWIPAATGTLEDGEVRDFGDLRVRALHVPGHTRGQLAFLVNDALLCTGDTLFRGSVGGTVAPGHTTFQDLRRSILEVLLALPRELRILPGHAGETTVAAECRHNPFVRAWRGELPLLDRPVRAGGRPARLLLEAPDYDGGTKVWLRWEGGGEDVVPGSWLE